MIVVARSRAIRGLTAYTIACAALCVIFVAILHTGGSVRLRFVTDSGGVRFDDVLYVATLIASTFALILGTHLAQERRTISFAWTKPLGRHRVAVLFMLADVGSIAVSLAITLLGLAGVLWSVGAVNHVRVDSSTGLVTLLALGTLVSWYAVVTAVSQSLNPTAAGVIAGISWPAFVGLALALTNMAGGPLRSLLRVIALLDPVAYLIGIPQFLAAALAPRVVGVWALAIAALAAAMILWSRRDA